MTYTFSDLSDFGLIDAFLNAILSLSGLCNRFFRIICLLKPDYVVKLAALIRNLAGMICSLSARLHPYVRNSAKRAVVGMPNTGLACHLLGLKSAETLHTSQFFGRLVENLVLGELLKQATLADEGFTLALSGMGTRCKRNSDFGFSGTV